MESGRRWVVLAAGVVACPTFGLLAMLVVWGWLADRYGERGVIAVGLGGAGAILLAASAVHGPMAPS